MGIENLEYYLVILLCMWMMDLSEKRENKVSDTNGEYNMLGVERKLVLYWYFLLSWICFMGNKLLIYRRRENYISTRNLVKSTEPIPN